MQIANDIADPSFSFKLAQCFQYLLESLGSSSFGSRAKTEMFFALAFFDVIYHQGEE